MTGKGPIALEPGVIYSDGAWWLAEAKGKAPHELLWPHVERLKMRQATRYMNFRKLINIFEWGYRAGESAESTDVPLHDNILAFNAAQNTIETLWAQLNEDKLALMPITTGGGYLQRQRAKKLGCAIDGEFDENDFDQVQEDVTKDGFVLGLGAAKVFREWGRVRIEHVPGDDLLVDDGEGRQRHPRSIYQRAFVDRFVLAEKYGVDAPDLFGDAAVRKRRILDAGHSGPRGVHHADSDLVEVWEAWHLPSRPLKNTLATSEEPLDEEPSDTEAGEDDGGEEETDGCHVLVIQDCTLLCEPWTRNRFPFAVFCPRRRMRSFWGLSEMAALASAQREYEKVTEKIQQANQRMGGTHIIAPKDAALDERDIDNGQGTFIAYNGPVPPQVFNPEPVHPQTYQYQQGLPDVMMRMRGVSPTSAQSQVPAGLSQASGKALEVFTDEGSRRRIIEKRALERFKVDCAQLVIEESRLLVEENPSYTTRYRGQKLIESLKWKEILLDEDEFVLTIPPVSGLSKTPATKFAQLDRYFSAGAINLEQYRRLSGIPDMEAENEIDTADTDIIDKTLEEIVLSGKYEAPEPFDNLALAESRAGKFVNVCRKGDVPTDRIDLLHQYISDVQSLKARAAQAAAPASPAGGAPPEAQPPVAPGGAPAAPMAA